MDSLTYQKLRDIIYQISGITLGEGKEALMESRVGRRLRILGLSSYKDYLQYLQKDHTRQEVISLIDVISTNVTSFFREAAHFDVLAHHYEQCLLQGQYRFRFWSAACSSGEEPYSIAMTLHSLDEKKISNTRVLATDISTTVLQKAIKGVYSTDSVKLIHPNYKQQYFIKQSDEVKKESHYSIHDSIKQMVLFKQMNLSKPPFPMKGPLDAVFCRNVMIYFDLQVRQALIDEIYRLLKPGGLFFVGHSESLLGINSKFRVMQPSIYIK